MHIFMRKAQKDWRWPYVIRHSGRCALLILEFQCDSGTEGRASVCKQVQCRCDKVFFECNISVASVSTGTGHVATERPPRGGVYPLEGPCRSSEVHECGPRPEGTHEGPSKLDVADVSSSISKCDESFEVCSTTRRSNRSNSGGSAPQGHDAGRTMVARMVWPAMVVLLLLAVAGPCLTFYLLIKVSADAIPPLRSIQLWGTYLQIS
ncbi:hypothetical protein SK128_010208 [Halocaridina rubra]|uniref:Uncharacterized protein n=1 Tax=Halocaridina rubra TaxID=373956 RepID=A0AAN9A9T4_HALRR